MAERTAPEQLWYKDAIVYQLHVRAFYDGDGDGIGDFRGLTNRLGYLQDLGVTALWLLPFYPSPLRDEGYDIADHRRVHPDYGTLDDFSAFLGEAHGRGLRVISEIVLNHTSDEHPWFQRARSAPPGSRERDYYIWSDTPDRYSECRVLLPDSESSNWAWDPVARAYYWHRFYSYEPDLNYTNPEVQAAMLETASFWLEHGVDGLGLAAIPYLFDSPGATCENLPETHAFLKRLRSRLEQAFPGSQRVLVAEANEWPEDAAAYLQGDDECQMAVHFPAAPRLFMAVRSEDRFPLVDILKQTPAVPETCQWAFFLRNHDELMLEMATDEERDYMYRTYARDPQARIHQGIRRRLAPLLGNNRRQVELLHMLLFSLPGTPVLYYGDEIGMGDNIYLGGRAGVRTPMQWNTDRNAGFSRANPQQLYLPVISDPEYHYETVNVEAQQSNPNSLWWWTRRLIALRKRFPALGRGDLEFVPSANRKVLAFIRRPRENQAQKTGEPAGDGSQAGNETVLVVANLSRYVEYVELDLGRFQAWTPVEAIGRREFPPIGDEPYRFMLGPYACYWFALTPAEAEQGAGRTQVPPLRVAGSWEEILQGAGRHELEARLPAYLRQRRWFRGKARAIRLVEVLDAVPIPLSHGEEFPDAAGNPAGGREPDERAGVAYLLPVHVDYAEGDAETYVLAVAWAHAERAGRILDRLPQAAIARLEVGRQAPGADAGSGHGLLYDALWEPGFSSALLAATGGRQRFDGPGGVVVADPTTAFDELRGRDPLVPRMGHAEQSNTSVVFSDRLILKVFRRIESGINPDVEVTRFLTERTDFKHIPRVAGGLAYLPRLSGDPAGAAERMRQHDREQPEAMALGIIQAYVPNDGDAWAYTLDALGRYVELIQARADLPPETQISTHILLDAAHGPAPELACELLGEYLDAAGLLGQRTAELHVALASDDRDPAFAPEPFTTLYQRSLYQSMRTLVDQVFDLANRRLPTLPDAVQAETRRLLDQQGRILEQLRELTSHRATALRMRTHGDYHLGQVLHTGNDFVIIDFEGEPGRPLSERRFKRGALRDVAGMLRSFQYAAYGRVLFDEGQAGPVRPEDAVRMQGWALYWQKWTCATFLKAYLEVAGQAGFLPHNPAELQMLLDAYLLEKAVYELGYELNNRPGWVIIPVRSLLQLLEA